MQNFKQAYQKTSQFEGGYSNDPSDKGGETYKGISRRYWPDWEGWKIIDIYKTKYAGIELNQSLDANKGLQGLVQQFYYEHYWLAMQCDEFSLQVASELFDTAVNQGKWKAASYLQKALNKLNRNGKDYPDIIVDGKIGLQTKQAYEAYMDTERFASRNEIKLIAWLIKWLNYYQLKEYDNLTTNDPRQEIYIPGWTERS